MPKYTIEGQEIINVVYTIEAEHEGAAMEKLDACLNDRDWYVEEDGSHVPCDPKDYVREVKGIQPVPDTWCVLDENGELLL